MTKQQYITLTMTPGGKQTVPLDTTLAELLPKEQDPCQPVIVAALVNNQLKDLRYPLFCDSEIEWLDYTHATGNRIFKQSLSFLLFVVCQELYPHHTLRVLHSLRNGRYCELTGEPKLEIQDFEAIAARMQELVAADLPIQKSPLSKADAIRFFRSQGDDAKANTLALCARSQVNLYTLHGHSQYLFSKLVPSTGFLDNFAIQPFDDGFVLLEPNSFQMAVCAGNRRQKEEFAFPHRLQASLKSYSTWGNLLGMSTIDDINRCIQEDDFPNLIIMAESLQQRAMLEIADEIYQDFPKVKIVLIAGPSSSGKTTFTKRLAIEFRALGLKPIVLSMDNYFLNREDTPLDENGEKDFEGIRALDLPLFNRQLLQMIAGEAVELPIYDFKTGCRSEKTIPVQLSEKHILLIEGIHGINEELTAQIPAANKRKIYISCLTQLNADQLTPISSTDNRELRRLIRDLKFRGTPTEQTLLSWKQVRAGEEKNIFPFQESADYYFNSSLLYEFPILRPMAEEHLRLVQPDSPAYAEAQRLLKLVRCFRPIAPRFVPAHSLLQEFLGGSCFEQ